MTHINIVGDNHFDTWTKERTACRGIVIERGKILLSYEEQTDLYMLPGGGMEKGETAEQCCRRELAEETGVQVSVGEHYLTVHEFYEEWRYETRFFLCETRGEGERALTEREKQVKLIPRWVSFSETLSIFSKHREYAETSEEKRGIYLREYTALLEFLKTGAAKYIEIDAFLHGKD